MDCSYNHYTSSREKNQGPGKNPSLLAEIPDGTSYTILVAVADEPTPWTKPGELPFDPKVPLPALYHRDPEGYQFGLVDGSVRSLAVQDAGLLPAFITRAGGEVVQWPPVPPPRNAPPVEATLTLLPTATVDPTATPGGAVATGDSGLTSVQALEQRMQRLEERLESILKRLDAGDRKRPE